VIVSEVDKEVMKSTEARAGSVASEVKSEKWMFHGVPTCQTNAANADAINASDNKCWGMHDTSFL